jgi:hypothetical protein
VTSKTNVNKPDNYAIILWHDDKIMQIRTLYSSYEYVKSQVEYMKSIQGTQITEISVMKTVSHSVPEEEC